ncbi:sorbitol dehydrogenase-like protein [Hyaloraphidium curvatum]|nr:sorbitol dehydrogenase-like protein [Hyaloraphidium curvatum]
MKALYLHETRRLQVDDVPEPREPEEGEVLLDVARVGICGSDVHIFRRDYGAAQDMLGGLPMAMGHEASGIVRKLGPGVTDLKVGDKVAIFPDGLANMDLLREKYIHPAKRCLKLPEHVSLEEGAMVEPFAVGLRAVKRAGDISGKNVLIIGAGPVGLFTIVGARAMGPKKLVSTDVKAGRLSNAKQFGADATVLAEGLDQAALAAKVAEQFDGPIDVVIDAAGHPATVDFACDVVKPQGTVVYVGMATHKGDYDYFRHALKEISFHGSFGYGPEGEEYPAALQLMIDGKAKIRDMATHVVNMEEAQKYYEFCEKGVDAEGKPVLKVVFKVND